MNYQRTPEWYEIRRGKFTASEIHKLLVSGKTKDKLFGDVASAYVFEKAVEFLYGIDEENDFTSFDMQRGIDLEPMAFRKFQELKGLEFIDVKESFFIPYKDYAGASPDGLVGSDGSLEIKCPRRQAFFNIVANGEKAIKKEYYAQMQFQMFCSNSVRCHFFNYGIFEGKEYWHEMVIHKDDKMFDEFHLRLPEALKLRNEYVKNILENKQF